MTNRIVLDTNCLIASLSKKGNYFPVWQGLHQGKYTLCVSNEILEEYCIYTAAQIQRNYFKRYRKKIVLAKIKYFVPPKIKKLLLSIKS